MKKYGKILYITGGAISFIMGCIGIVVPGIPTTPFWILSLWCFSHSWLVAYEKLNQNSFIKKYVNRDGVSLKSKLTYIATMVLMVSFSVRLYWGNKAIAFSLIGISIVGLIFMIKHIKVIDKKDINKKN